MMRILASAAVLCLAAMSAAPAVASTLLYNGSFELDDGLNGTRFTELAGPSGRNWNVFNALPGWTKQSDHGIEVQTNRTLRSIDAQDGLHYIELDSHGNAAMAQELHLGPGRYQLSFWYSPRTRDASTNGISYGVMLGATELMMGEVVGPGADTAVGLWTQVVQSFEVVTAETVDLIFAATGRSNSYGGLIDNVELSFQSVLNEEPPSAVPVPPAGLLFLAGIGGFAALKRRARGSAGRFT